MNVNKKLGRFKQWAGEKMGGEIKTGTSDEFKALEMEMNLRHEGMYTPGKTARRRANRSTRHGQNAEVHDRLRQVALEAR
jgi:hypothetical protein